jgi:hypothetical protein
MVSSFWTANLDGPERAGFTVGFPIKMTKAVTDHQRKVIDGYLAYRGANVFYASDVPEHDQEQPVFTTSDNVQVSFLWQAK